MLANALSMVAAETKLRANGVHVIRQLHRTAVARALLSIRAVKAARPGLSAGFSSPPAKSTNAALITGSVCSSTR